MANTMTVTSRGMVMTAELYIPQGVTTCAAIIIAYGSDGLTDDLSGPWATMIRGYARSLAEKGFAAVIPDYLAVTGSQPGPGVFQRILQERDHWQEAISDTVDHSKTLPMVDANRIGLLGFSLGGHLSLRLRAKAKVLVEFFAPALDGIGADGTLKHAQIHHGEADNLPGTEFKNAVTIANLLRTEGTSTELFPYPGACHGFIGTDSANTNARGLSKARTMSFFGSYL